MNMMGPWGYGGYGNMMGWAQGGLGFGIVGILGTIFWILILINLILVTVWLWREVNKKK